MKSKIAAAVDVEYGPVAVLWADEEPEGALRFPKGRWGCVMTMFAQVAAKGKTAAFDRETPGCRGGAVGLGFGNFYENWPGGIENFYSFLSTGDERYVKTPEHARSFVESMPIVDVPTRHVVFKPLAEVGEDEKPEVVVFTVDADRLSALVVLANYGRHANENVYAPFGAGCHTIGVLVYAEAARETPRAVIGLTDISARVNTLRLLGRDALTFAVPFKMFLEMEENVEGSFLGEKTWKKLTAKKPGKSKGKGK